MEPRTGRQGSQRVVIAGTIAAAGVILALVSGCAARAVGSSAQAPREDDVSIERLEDAGQESSAAGTSGPAIRVTRAEVSGAAIGTRAAMGPEAAGIPPEVAARDPRPVQIPAPPSPPGTAFWVIMSRYRTAEPAETLAHRVRAEGFPAQPVPFRVNDAVWYGVRVGPYEDEAEAVAAGQALKSRGHAAWLSEGTR